ncbi:type II toxin-antitoxin system VapB family antitoxin [Granulicoccus sp. GXG6511]|uniref:type II toxin-antitoxin system VapB family antitoxin n=1 Tax=Granulicoccus sp. GXG6511 TaxID=3381351 RepID=UPI003D7DB20B
MTDVLIRDVPEDDLRKIDAEAARLGLSRNAFLRREMHRIARHRTVGAATAENYRQSLDAVPDIDSDEVARQAWS